MSKRVIFIAGANHSGSTLAGCILGAHPKQFTYFHVGELHAFFLKKNYGNPKAARNTLGGEIWDTINPDVGYESAYKEIFAKTNAEIIVDSSKTPHNLQIAMAACKKNQWPLHIVVTFRPFAKIWKSDLKRDKMESSIRKNIKNYLKHKEKISASVYPWTILNVEPLILKPREMTKALCEAVRIPYFEGKEEYWNYPSCHLYGSITQRRHLKNPESAQYDARKADAQAQIEHSFLQDKNIRAVEEYLSSRALTLQTAG